MKMTYRGARRALAGVAAAAALVAGAGCASTGGGSSEDVPGVTDDEIVLGATYDTTGPAATFGEGYEAVTKAYFDKINADGGIHGRKLKFVHYNDNYEPAKAAANARRLVERDKVFALILASASAPSNAIKEYVASRDVPFLMITSSGESTDPPERCCFSAITPAEYYGAAMVDYAANTLDKKKVALIYTNDDLGQAAIKGVESGVKKQGAELVASVGFEATATEFAVEVEKLKAAKPDVVLIVGGVPPTAGILKTAQAQGLDATFISSTAAQNPATLELAGKAAEGVYFAFVWPPVDPDTTDPDQKELQDMLVKAGVPLDKQGSQETMPYVNLQLTVKALEAAGKDLTRDKFIEALEGINDEKMTTSANITFGKYDKDDQLSRLGNTSVGFAVVENGKFKRLTDDWIDARD